jgi:hypothetical protein
VYHGLLDSAARPEDERVLPRGHARDPGRDGTDDE